MVRGAVFGAMVFASLSGMSGTASATELASVKVGRWTVWGGVDEKNPEACAAIVSNGKDELRLLTDGQTWKVGTAYYGTKKKIEAYYGFETAGEVGTFVYDGMAWMMMKVAGEQLLAFRDVPVFAITVDGKEMRWKLDGAGAAIDRTMDCARAKGVKAAAAPAPAPQAGGRNCPAAGSVRSVEAKRPVEVMFVNETKAPLDIYWIGYQGERKKYQRVAPHSNVKQKTFATHPWIAVDPRGDCHGGVMLADPNDRSEGANMFQIWD